MTVLRKVRCESEGFQQLEEGKSPKDKHRKD